MKNIATQLEYSLAYEPHGNHQRGKCSSTQTGDGGDKGQVFLIGSMRLNRGRSHRQSRGCGAKPAISWAFQREQPKRVGSKRVDVGLRASWYQGDITLVSTCNDVNIETRKSRPQEAFSLIASKWQAGVVMLSTSNQFGCVMILTRKFD